MATVAAVEFDLESLINLHRGLIRRREFVPFGLLEKIQFEKSTVSNVKNNPLAGAKDHTASLDWRVGATGKGALLSISRDHQDILICSPLPHPPKLPRPGWVPRCKYEKVKRGRFKGDMQLLPQKPPMIEQRLRDLAYGVIETKDGPFFLCQPVSQILVILQERTGWGTIECSADHSGRHTAFLFNPRRQEGFFVYGAKRFERYEGH